MIMKSGQRSGAASESGRSNGGEQVVRVVVKINYSAQRVSYCLNLRSGVVYIGNDDEIPVCVLDRSREDSSTRLGICAESDDSAVGPLCRSRRDNAVGACLVRVIDQRPVGRVHRTDGSPIEKLNASCVAVSRAIGFDDHAPAVNGYAKQLSETKIETRSGPAVIVVVIDLTVGLVPHTGVIDSTE